MQLKNILIVDDSEAEQFLYKHLFKKFSSDIEVTAAHDGVEALKYLENQERKPDCILVDINMPRMNGFEFLDQHGEKLEESNTAVAMLSSSAQNADKEKALSYQCVKAYFQKPISIEDLETLEKMCNE